MAAEAGVRLPLVKIVMVVWPAPGSHLDMATGLKFEKRIACAAVEAKEGDTATGHCTWWLTDGGQFDRSVDRNEPWAWAPGGGQVIAGWDQGVATMKAGDPVELPAVG